ncbi:MAG: tetratricopeptide repeat protein, partial [Chloroflexota bacterium]|nr:tetratricopeptide repeat protein [Chloroflexota bacterium]
MIKASTQQQKNRNVESDIDLLSTAPELQSVVPSNPHNILTMVQQHTTIMIGPVVESVAVLELLTQICQQLRYVGQHNYKLVIQEYTKAVEHYPNNAYVHFSLGTLGQQSGNYNKAIDAFTQAMSENTIEVIARYNIAQCLLCQGYPDLAIQQLLHALRTARGASNESFANSVWAARPHTENKEDGTPEREIFKLLEKADKRIQRLTQKQPILQLKQTPLAHSTIVTPEEILTSPSSVAPSSSQEKLASNQDTLAGVLQANPAPPPTQDTATSHHEELLEIEENSDTDSSLQIYDDEVHPSHYDGQTEHTLNELNGMVRLAPDDPGLHNELADTYLQRGLLDDAISELR